jgi:hypothetical protein
MPFVGLAAFLFFYMTFFSFFLLFGLLAVLYEVLDSNFKLYAFIVNGLIKGEIEKPSGYFLGLSVMSHWLADVWIWVRDILVVLPLSLFCLENHVCLSRGVQVEGAAWHAATRIVAGVGDLVQRIGDGRTGRVLGGRLALCVVCTVHMETRRVGFLVEPQNQGRGFVSGLASKPLGRFDLKTGGDGFSVCAPKPAAMV